MTTFDRATLLTLKHEGGLATDPNDPGGVTKFGISKRAYPHLDIPAITVQDAIGIYSRDYWTPLHCDALPVPLAIFAFDSAVNQGVTAATKMLQQAAGCAVDGIFGPRTLEAVRLHAMPDLIITFAALRMARYQGDRNWLRYRNTWSGRVLDVLVRAFVEDR